MSHVFFLLLCFSFFIPFFCDLWFEIWWRNGIDLLLLPGVFVCVCFVCLVVWSYMVGWFRFYDAFVSTDVSVRRQDCISQRLPWFGWVQSHFNWNQRSFIYFFLLLIMRWGRGNLASCHQWTDKASKSLCDLYYQISHLVRDAKFQKSISENVNWVLPKKIDSYFFKYQKISVMFQL